MTGCSAEVDIACRRQVDQTTARMFRFEHPEVGELGKCSMAQHPAALNSYKVDVPVGAAYLPLCSP